MKMLRRSSAAARAVLALKLRLAAAGERISLTASEHAMVAADFERWVDEEHDSKKAA